MSPSLRSVAVLIVLAAFTRPARADAAGDELQGRVAELEAQVRFLTEELGRLRAGAAPSSASPATDPRTAEIERKVDVLAEEISRQRLGVSFDAPLASRWGLGPAASKVYGAEKGVSIGGYGEILYQAFESERDDGARSGRKDEIDALRAILYFGCKFSDRIVFNSEIEFEHANTGESGEVEVEFAAVDFLVKDAFNVRAGMVLVPVGLVNEMHEPTTFWSARRPQVETTILPTTWSENGVLAFGEAGWFSYRAGIVAGLEASGFSAGNGLRGGRQKGSRSAAEDLAIAVRADFDPVPGLSFGLSGLFGDAGQDAKAAGDEIDTSVSLWDAHLSYQWRGFGFRALYAQGNVDGAEQVNALLGLVGDASIGSRLDGWYAEAGYDVLSHLEGERELILFARHEEYDTQARVPAGFLRNPANDRTVDTFGLAFKPHPQVVIKLDWQDFANGAGTGVDQVNLALGYSF